MAIAKISNKAVQATKTSYFKDNELELFSLDIYRQHNILVDKINEVIDKLNEVIDKVNTL
ncbi:MAG: hypothetical protein AB1567_08850 [bacterium]